MTDKPGRVGLLIEEEHDRYGKSYHITARFVQFNDAGKHCTFYGWEYGYTYAFAGLTLSAVGFDDYVGTDRRMMSNAADYRNVTRHLDSNAVDLMVATFKRIHQALDRDSKREGHAASLGQVFLRAARALGADCMVIPDTSQWTDADFRTVSLVDGCEYVNRIERQWQYTVNTAGTSVIAV